MLDGQVEVESDAAERPLSRGQTILLQAVAFDPDSGAGCTTTNLVEFTYP